MDDLIALVADKDMEYAIQALLTRTRSLGIRSVSCNILVHPLRDPGCWNEAEAFLRPFIKQYHYAIVLFDYEGSGQETKQPHLLEQELEKRLADNGWENGRARVVMLVPELEIWVWSNSPRVDEILGWSGQQPDLRTWLQQKGMLEQNAIKPSNPKLAMEQVLRFANKPRSAALYKQLAETVSLKGCIDPCFKRFCSIVQEWFSPTA